MIRELKLICSKCNKNFTAKDKLIYKDNFIEKSFSNIELICSKCFTIWEKSWNLKKAEFIEEFGILYVNIFLKDEVIYEKIHCSPVDDLIVLDIEIPLKAQKELYIIYKKWHNEKMKDILMYCNFNESFMKTTFTCETFSGEKYENIAFRFTRAGVFETEIFLPDNIKEQVVTAWSQYELSNIPNDFLSKE